MMMYFRLPRFAVLLFGVFFVCMGCSDVDVPAGEQNKGTTVTKTGRYAPFDGERAMRYLTDICHIGPRPSCSEGMRRQQELLIQHFTPLVERTGGRVSLQTFEGKDPRDQSICQFANLVVEWYPERPNRILLCAHYDTLPYPMRDAVDPKGVFVGANDGASGVALLMVLGEELASLNLPFGVDFVLFDAEEYRFAKDDPFCLGSTYFAQTVRDAQNRQNTQSHQTMQENAQDRQRGGTSQTVSDPLPATSHTVVRYHAAVLLDMIADADLKIFQEHNSLSWRDSRPLVQEIWNVASRVGVREFVSRPKYWIEDDHLPLHEIAEIPACDLIDFDYPVWHTRADTPDQCSAKSLAKVGLVVREWLKTTRCCPNR